MILFVFKIFLSVYGKFLIVYFSFQIALLNFFDGDCSDRSHHILSIMTFYELTEFELWFQRITTVAVIGAVGYTLFKLLNSLPK